MKEVDIVRKRNLELNSQLEELKKQNEELQDKIEFDKEFNQNSLMYAKELIAEMEVLKEQYEKGIESLKNKTEELEDVILNLKMIDFNSIKNIIGE